MGVEMWSLAVRFLDGAAGRGLGRLVIIGIERRRLSGGFWWVKVR